MPPIQQELATPNKHNRKQQGLFWELLYDDYAVLYYDMLDRPELYDEKTRDLLEQLVDQRRKIDDLSDKERKMLDVATLEYATRPPLPSHERERKKLLERTFAKMTVGAAPISGVPEESLPTFWWVR